MVVEPRRGHLLLHRHPAHPRRLLGGGGDERSPAPVLHDPPGRGLPHYGLHLVQGSVMDRWHRRHLRPLGVRPRDRREGSGAEDRDRPGGRCSARVVPACRHTLPDHAALHVPAGAGDRGACPPAPVWAGAGAPHTPGVHRVTRAGAAHALQLGSGAWGLRRCSPLPDPLD